MAISEYVDCYGNRCGRVMAPAGRIVFRNDAVVEDCGLPDLQVPGAFQHNVQELPAGYPGSVPPAPPLSDSTKYYEEQYKKALLRQIADDGIQGNLIREQPTTRDHGCAVPARSASAPSPHWRGGSTS